MGILAIIGVIVFLIGWIWMIVVAFKQGGVLWGILVFLFSWIAGLIFAIMNKTGWTQVGLMILGFVLLFLGGAMSGGIPDATPVTRP